MVKLLIVDQHPVIRKGLELIFNTSNEIEVSGVIDDAKAISNFIKNEDVDVILSEINFKNANGITELRQLKKAHPTSKLIFFTSQAEDVYAVSAIKAGAKGFVSKNEDMSTLEKAIIKVSKGELYLSKEINEAIETGKRTHNFSFKKLSNRETEVLKLLSAGKRNNEISKSLKINEKTVSTYKMRLMKKLDASNLIDLVTQAQLLNL